MTFPAWGVTLIVVLLELAIRYLKNGTPETPIHAADEITTALRKSTLPIKKRKSRVSKNQTPEEVS